MIGRLATRLDTESPRALRQVVQRAQPAGYGYVALDRCAIRYRAHGRGARTFVFAADPPIVLEHYDALVAELVVHGRVIVLELPGFGFSPAAHGFDFSFASAVATVAAFLDRLEVRDATLCFPCLSGLIAAGVATARPELVRALVLAQTPSRAGAEAWARGRDPKRIIRRPVVGQLAMRALKIKRAPDWFGVAVDAGAAAALTPLAVASLRAGARWSLASAFQRFFGEAPAPVVQPIVALWGLRDRSHALTDRASSRALGRSVRLLEWDDAGHFPELEQPARFARLLVAEPVEVVADL
jgi:pimeloyl-ACP methyl ester carboxylesterase